MFMAARWRVKPCSRWRSSSANLKVHLWLVYVGTILVYASTFVDRSWHIGDNMLGFFWILFAFDLVFCLVLSCPHWSLPALEDKLGCYPRGRCGVVCVGKMLDAVFLDHCWDEILRMLTWNFLEVESLEAIYSNCFLVILCVYCILYLLD